MVNQSDLEAEFLWWWDASEADAGKLKPVLGKDWHRGERVIWTPQVKKLVPKRRFIVDFLHYPTRTIVEVQGGNWRQGRHSRAAGIIADYEKWLTLLAAGYSVIPLAPENWRNFPATYDKMRRYIEGRIQK